MPYDSSLRWPLIVALVGLYVFTAIRIALWAHRNGRNGWFWLVVSLLLTGIPATVYFNYLAGRDRWRYIRGRDQHAGEHVEQDDNNTDRDDEPPPRRPSSDADSAAPPLVRCPHCRRMVTPTTHAGGHMTCGVCGLPIEPGGIA